MRLAGAQRAFALACCLGATTFKKVKYAVEFIPGKKLLKRKREAF